MRGVCVCVAVGVLKQQLPRICSREAHLPRSHIWHREKGIPRMGYQKPNSNKKEKKTTHMPDGYFVLLSSEKHHRPGRAEAGSRGEEDGGCCCTRLLVEQVGQLGPRICVSSRLRALARRSPAQVGEYGWQANGRARGRRQVGHGARRLLLLRAWSTLQRPREEIAAR